MVPTTQLAKQPLSTLQSCHAFPTLPTFAPAHYAVAPHGTRIDYSEVFATAIAAFQVSPRTIVDMVSPLSARCLGDMLATTAHAHLTFVCTSFPGCVNRRSTPARRTASLFLAEAWHRAFQPTLDQTRVNRRAVPALLALPPRLVCCGAKITDGAGDVTGAEDGLPGDEHVGALRGA